VSEAGRAVRQAAAIAGLSLVIAVAVQIPLIKRFARGEFRETFFEASAYPGIRTITLEEAEDLWRTAAAVCDARAEESYARGHMPGARNVPTVEARPALPDDLSSEARDKTLLVYCEGGDCRSSLTLAKRLHDAGFRDIRVFGGGWAAWVKAGLPEERSEKRGQGQGEKKGDGQE
jgi:rhodanese-related sulfurtransferase